MFDVGFSELLLILVVALVVVGPERLPKLARTAGLYLGRARRMAASVKADVQRELAAEDLKRTLQKQVDAVGLHDIVEETADAATSAERLFKPRTPVNAEHVAAPATSSTGTEPSSQPDAPHGGA
jgi:sec-independent protein translocase protein TatB